MSLDALRGFDMLFIMAFSQAVVAFCAWIGSADCWLARQMTHVGWHGLHHHDTIFPLFLFLAGVSWPFSLASQRAKGRSTGQIVLKIVRRMVLLVALGVMTPKFFAFAFDQCRYSSVLAHIGICWAGAALLYLFVRNWKVRFAVLVALLATRIGRRSSSRLVAWPSNGCSCCIFTARGRSCGFETFSRHLAFR